MDQKYGTNVSFLWGDFVVNAFNIEYDEMPDFYLHQFFSKWF